MLTIAATLFFISEILNVILRRSKKKEVKVSKDRFSLILLWTVILVSTSSSGFLAAMYPLSQRNLILEGSGLFLLIAGLVVRWTAIWQLGKMFTVDVSITHDHRIKDDGLYRYLRHPSYLGLILEFLGISLLYNSWIPILTINIPIFLALAYRIKVEESLLISYFGAEYRNYISRTRRIIPFIY